MRRREFLGTVAAGIGGLLGVKQAATSTVIGSPLRISGGGSVYCAPSKGVIWFSRPIAGRDIDRHELVCCVGEKDGRKIVA